MDLSKILSISGKNGLFKLVNQGKNNVIVESLEDGKRMPAFSHDGIATLDNISIFTYDDDVTLESVFQSIYKKENGAAPSTRRSVNLAPCSAIYSGIAGNTSIFPSSP